MAKIMGDPRMSPEHNRMPFDGKRIIFGVFEAIVNVGAESTWRAP
jgi:uncharacterized protein YbaA (DUF1428 family)